MIEPDEPLFQLPPEPGDELLQEVVLRRTLRTIHQRWWMRRFQYGAILGLVFISGMFTMNALEKPETRIVLVAAPVISAPVIQPKEESPRVEEPSPPVEARTSPAELELQAEKQFVRAESAQLFRKAGDSYLLDEGNFRAAIRCYRNYLDEADPKELNPADTDTWLLTSLKQARRD